MNKTDKPRLTKAAARLLAKLGGAHQDACLVLEIVERGYSQIPLFRARFKSVPCPTCGHPTKAEPVNWDTVESLEKDGFVAERIKGSSHFYITPAGRLALNTTTDGTADAAGVSE